MIYSSNNDIIENNDDNNGETIGLEFYFRNRFIERACDFILGKKSPLM